MSEMPKENGNMELEMDYKKLIRMFEELQAENKQLKLEIQNLKIQQNVKDMWGRIQ